MFRAPKLIQIRILQILPILHINSVLCKIDPFLTTFQWPDYYPWKTTTSPLPSTTRRQQHIDPRCLRSLKHDADIQNLYPGERWISTGWKDERTTWDEPRLCPDLTLVTEYGFLNAEEFFMTCIPAENMDDPDTGSSRKTVTIQIPAGRPMWDKLTMVPKLNRQWNLIPGRVKIADPNGTYAVTQFANGFSPRLYIMDNFEILLDYFDLTFPGGPKLKLYKYFEAVLNPWPVCPWADSSWTPPHECPTGHAICGVTSTKSVTHFAEMATFAFKCCPVCYPREKWGHIHTVINRSSKPYQHFDLDLLETTQRSGSVYHNDHRFNYDEYDYDQQASYMARFAPIFGPKAAHGFNWGWNGPDPDPAVDLDMGKNRTDLDLDLGGNVEMHEKAAGCNKKHIFAPCPAWSTCRYRQLLGLCGDKIVVITGHLDMDVGPLTFRDLFHCLVLGWESFFHHKNTCVAPSLLG